MSKGNVNIESEVETSYLKLEEGMDCAVGVGKLTETDVLCGDGQHGEIHRMLIYKPCEEVIFLLFIKPWEHTFRIARGRVIPLESWNDEYNRNIEGKFIISTLCVITFYSSLNVWCKNGQPMECLKLFHKVVNGLDPPFEVDGKLMRSLNVDSYDFARGRAFGVGDGLM